TDQEDVVPIAPGALLERVRRLRGELAAQLGGARARESGHALARAALVGRPNAGKSTLFHALLGRRRAGTSPVARTTPGVLAEERDLSREAPGAGVVLLQDLAGLDEVGREPEDGSGGIGGASQEAARLAVREADVLVWCDPSGRFEGVDVGAAKVVRVRTF